MIEGRADEVEKPDRPEVLGGITVKVITGCGNMYVQLNWYRGKLFEVFATLGHGGGCANSEMEALTRTITLGLKCGVPVGYYIKQLQGIRCPSPVMFPKEKRAESCPDAIASTMIKYGDLSIYQIIDLILKANGLSPEVLPEGDEEEAKQAAIAIEELAKQRRADGLYEHEEEQGGQNDNFVGPGPHRQNDPCPEA